MVAMTTRPIVPRSAEDLRALAADGEQRDIEFKESAPIRSIQMSYPVVGLTSM